MRISSHKWLLTCGIALVAILVGCNEAGSSKVKSFTLDSIVDQDSNLMLSLEKGRGQLNYSFSLIYPKGNESLYDNYIRSVLGDEYAGLSPEEIKAKYKAKTISMVTEVDPAFETDIEIGEPVGTFLNDSSLIQSKEDDELGRLPFEQSFSVDTICSEEHFFSVKTLYSEFFGGAHGMYVYQCYNFDPETGARITESDIFISGFESKLSKMMIDNLYKEGYDESMIIEPDVQPNGNFLLTSKGVSYVFNPYSVGPYAVGAPTVFLSWEELKDLIRPDSPIATYLPKD